MAIPGIFGILCHYTYTDFLLPVFLFPSCFLQTKLKNISQTHPVSVIICSRDEAANLAKNLPGALVQKYRTTHEVIVVNDNSSDESKYILEKYQKTFRQLQLVELKQESDIYSGKKISFKPGY